MTLINIVSIVIYTRGAPLKEKLQLGAMALIFLVLLYDSPSGLVIYWTMNNVFSLVKNILYGFKRNSGKGGAAEKASEKTHGGWEAYFYGVILLTLLTGAVIPLSVIVSSPEEFVTLTVYKDPLHYAFSSFLIAAGLFIVWFTVRQGQAGVQVVCLAVLRRSAHGFPGLWKGPSDTFVGACVQG